jgi:hypothetical protein
MPFAKKPEAESNLQRHLRAVAVIFLFICTGALPDANLLERSVEEITAHYRLHRPV